MRDGRRTKMSVSWKEREVSVVEVDVRPREGREDV